MDQEPANRESPPDTDGEKARTYTEEDVERRLRGSGKKIGELEARLKAFEESEARRKADDEAAAKKRLEEQGQFKVLLEQTTASKAAIEAELNALREREQQRLEAKREANEEKIKALPKEARELVPPGLDPDAMEKHLLALERRVKDVTIQVRDGGTRSPQTPEDAVAVANARGHQALFGSKKKEAQS